MDKIGVTSASTSHYLNRELKTTCFFQKKQVKTGLNLAHSQQKTPASTLDIRMMLIQNSGNTKNHEK